MNTDNKKVSISAVAKLCGVSTMTASRALRNSNSVKETTRLKILEIAEKLGYNAPVKPGRPSRIPAKRDSAVEIIIGLAGLKMATFYSELLTSIEQSLAVKEKDCIIRTFNGEYNAYLALRETLKKSAAGNTLITGYFPDVHLQGLLELKPDALLVDNPGSPELPRVRGSVSFDNAEAARLGIRHLLEKGREKILLISGYKDHYFSKEIEQGYREALSANGITIENPMMLNSDFTSEGACTTLAGAIERGTRFDAVFTNDEMACGAYRALHQKGIRIPDDVAVCGCDGLPVGEQIYPRLTTVKLDYNKLGHFAVDILLRREKDEIPPCRTKLLPELEVREST